MLRFICLVISFILLISCKTLEKNKQSSPLPAKKSNEEQPLTLQLGSESLELSFNGLADPSQPTIRAELDSEDFLQLQAKDWTLLDFDSHGRLYTVYGATPNPPPCFTIGIAPLAHISSGILVTTFHEGAIENLPSLRYCQAGTITAANQDSANKLGIYFLAKTGAPNPDFGLTGLGKAGKILGLGRDGAGLAPLREAIARLRMAHEIAEGSIDRALRSRELANEVVPPTTEASTAPAAERKETAIEPSHASPIKDVETKEPLLRTSTEVHIDRYLKESGILSEVPREWEIRVEQAIKNGLNDYVKKTGEWPNAVVLESKTALYSALYFSGASAKTRKILIRTVQDLFATPQPLSLETARISTPLLPLSDVKELRCQVFAYLSFPREKQESIKYLLSDLSELYAERQQQFPSSFDFDNLVYFEDIWRVYEKDAQWRSPDRYGQQNNNEKHFLGILRDGLDPPYKVTLAFLSERSQIISRFPTLRDLQQRQIFFRKLHDLQTTLEEYETIEYLVKTPPEATTERIYNDTFELVFNRKENIDALYFNWTQIERKHFFEKIKEKFPINKDSYDALKGNFAILDNSNVVQFYSSSLRVRDDMKISPAEAEYFSALPKS